MKGKEGKELWKKKRRCWETINVEFDLIFHCTYIAYRVKRKTKNLITNLTDLTFSPLYFLFSPTFTTAFHNLSLTTVQNFPHFFIVLYYENFSSLLLSCLVWSLSDDLSLFFCCHYLTFVSLPSLFSSFLPACPPACCLASCPFSGKQNKSIEMNGRQPSSPTKKYQFSGWNWLFSLCPQ